jgi:hypothetical protein
MTPWSVLPSKLTFLCCTHSMSSVHNGANTDAHNFIWSVNTCFAVPLHKPSRNEPRQKNYHAAQTASKLTQTILVRILMFKLGVLPFSLCVSASKCIQRWRRFDQACCLHVSFVIWSCGRVNRGCTVVSVTVRYCRF